MTIPIIFFFMLYFHVALPSEARPLIDFYQLRQDFSPNPFRIYKSGEVCLVISGQGKVATAAAISATSIQFQKHPGPWVNVGIAGHASASIGDIFLINKAVEHSTKSTYYPSIPFETPFRGSKIITCDQPTSKYPDNCLYDMECSAFFHIGQQYVPAELVHSIKIVSDNIKNPFKDITSKVIIGHIASAIDGITNLHDCMAPFVKSWIEIEANPSFYTEAITRWKFSQTQQSELLRLLRQWQTVSSHKLPWIKTPASSHEVLIKLKNALSDVKNAPDLSSKDA